MNTSRVIIFSLSLLLLCATLVSACSGGNDVSREDAQDVTAADKSPPLVISFNNHFPNVETKCGAPGQRVYVSTHDSSTGNNLVIVNDESCR